MFFEHFGFENLRELFVSNNLKIRNLSDDSQDSKHSTGYLTVETISKLECSNDRNGKDKSEIRMWIHTLLLWSPYGLTGEFKTGGKFLINTTDSDSTPQTFF